MPENKNKGKEEQKLINTNPDDIILKALDGFKEYIDSGKDFSSLNDTQLRQPGYSTGDFMNDYGSSRYDKPLTEQYFDKYGDGNLPYQEQRAQEQSGLAKIGSGLGNAAVTVGLDIIKDASYLLDYRNYTNFKEQAENGFHNDVADVVQGIEDNLKLLVYRTEESKGFSPLSAGWWGDNLPSITSGVAMAFPAEFAVAGLGKLGNLLGGGKIIKSLEALSGVEGLASKAKGVGSALVSRQMEAIMEGGQTYEDTYQTAIQTGKTEQEAKQIAGEAAAKNYELNWAAIVQDIPQYMILHKSFKESSSLFSKEGLKEVAKTALGEGAEEGYQFITDKEAKRSALINGKILKDDNSTLGERLIDYSKDSDFWTSSFFGAIGGAGFAASGVANDNKNQKQFDNLLEMHKGILKNDLETYNRGVDNLLNNKIVDKVENNSLESYKQGLKSILDNPERVRDEDRTEVINRTKEAIKQVDYAQNLQTEIMNDNSIDTDLKKLTFNTRLNQRSIENRLNEINNKLNTLSAKDAINLGFTADIQAYKAAKLKYEGIKDIPILNKQAIELKKNLDVVTLRLRLDETNQFKMFADIDKHIISSNDKELKDLYTNQAIEQINLEDTKDIIHNISSEDGKKLIKEKLEKAKVKEQDYNNINNSIDNATTEKDLNALLKEADTKELTNPELIDKISIKRQEIKNIKAQEAINNAFNPSEIISENIEDNNTDINIDESNINIPNVPNDDNGKTPETPHKTNNGLDNNTDINANRAYRTYEKLIPDDHRLKLVTRNNNLKLYNDILNLDESKKKFEEDYFNGKLDKSYYPDNKITKNIPYQGIYTVLTDKNNKLILTDNKLVFSTLETSKRIDKGDIRVKDKIKSINDLNNFRSQILASKDSNIYLQVTGKSKGILEFLPQINNKRQSISVEQSIGLIDSIELEVPTQQVGTKPGMSYLSKNNQIALTGKLYTYDKNDTAIDLIPRNLNDNEAEIIINLTYQKLGLIPQTVAKPITEIQKLISTSIPKTGANTYTFGFKDNNLYIGNNILTSTDFQSKPAEINDLLKNFLTNTKYVNININKKNGYDLESNFVGPTTDDKVPGKSYNKYKEYLLEGENPMFGTDLAPTSQVQYRNVYLTYDNNIKTNELGELEEQSNSLGDPIESVSLDDIFNENPINKPKNRDFYKSSNTDESESLDRKVSSVKTKNKELTQSEKDWFKSKFPNIPIEQVKGLIENRSFGRFISSGKVLLSNIAPAGTLYHEAFHTVTQLYLTDKKVKDLYNEVKNKLDNQYLTDLQAEEILAEDFASYKENGKILNDQPKRNTLFRKILDLIKRLVGLPSNSIQDIYNRIDKGYYTNKKQINRNQFNSLDSSLPGLTVTQTKELYESMDAMFSDIVFKDNKTPSQALSKTDKVLEYIYKRLVKKEDELSSNPELSKVYGNILDNWDKVIVGWKERMLALGVPIEDTKETNEEFINTLVEYDDETKVEDKGERSGSAYTESNEVSTKSTMFTSSKILIRTLKQKNLDGTDKLNSLDLPQTVEFASTYNYILKQTVGLSEYNDIYNKLVELSNSRPELKDLLLRLKEPSDTLPLEQILLQRQFRQDFSKNLSDIYITSIQKDGTILQVNSVKQNIQERVKDRWKSNLKLLAKTLEDGRLIVEPKQTKDNIEYLKSIGMEFSKESLPLLTNSKELSDSTIAIRNYIKENNGDISKLYDNSTDNAIVGRINNLIAIESENNNSIMELSVKSTIGKTIYPVSNNNGLSIIKNAINNSKNLSELYNTLPNLNTTNTQNSVWLSKIFDSNGNKIKGAKLYLNLADGLNNKGDLEVENSTANLGSTDKFIQEIDHLLKYGNSSVIRTSDKATEHTIGLGKLIIPIEDLEISENAKDITGFNNEKIKNIFRGYFKSELKRIADFELYDIGKDIDQYSKTGGELTIFHSFPDIKSIKENQIKPALESIRKSVDNGLSNEEVDKLVDNLYSSLIQYIDESTVKFFTKYEAELTNKLIEYKVIDSFSNEFNKYPKDQLIRTVVVNDFINKVEQTKLMFGDMAFYKALFKRTSSLAGTKDTSATDEELNKWLNKDNKRLDGKIANGKINVVIFEDVTQSKQDLGEYKKSLMSTGLSESEASKLLKPYNKMDEGDAQGWITLDELREFKIRLGQWSTSLEKVWDKAQKYDKNDSSTHLTKEELNNIFFIVMKAQYAGPTINSKLFVPGFHKFSLLPLIPQLVEGKNMSKVLANMTRQQIGYGLFKSGSKVGTPLINNKANNFYINTNNGDINTQDYNKQVVDYKFLGIQVKSSEPHDTVTYGTQFRKLLFSGAFEDGKERISGSKELFDEYTKLIKDQIEESKSKLIKDLGLDPDNLQSKDVTKLVELLKSEAKSRVLADNIVDSIQTSISEANNIDLKYPLDSSVNKSKIDSLIMSLMNTRLIKQKVNGDAYIQGASSGFETLGVRDIGTNKQLRFYRKLKNGQTSKAEVMIPMSKNYYSLLNKYGSIEAINQAIKESKIDSRLLTLIGYRIPTQGLNSIDHLTIKEFLPELSGQLIILPTEIVAKSGGDYDIDKMNIFRPDITDKGELANTSHNKIIDISSKMLSHPDNFNALITPNSTNILTDAAEDIIYEQYKSTGGNKSKDDYLKGQSKAIDYTRQLMLTENVIQQHTKLMAAKGGIGPGAISNVFLPLAQSVGVEINKQYKVENETKTVNINFPHNKLENGNLNLSKSTDATGNTNIQEVNSQIINAFVDAANSPELLPALNMNMDTLGVYLYLNSIGVPFEFSFYMMNQPIIKEYIKELSINESGYLTANKTRQVTKELQNRIMKSYLDRVDSILETEEFNNTSKLKKFSVYDVTKHKDNNEFYNTQVQIFKDFLNYKEQSQLLSDAIRSINFDTAGLPSNLEQVHLKLSDIEKVKNDNFVIGLEKIKEQTPIGAFDQNQFAIDVYSQFYATQDKDIREGLYNIYKEINPVKTTDKNRILNLINNDFINYVIQNYGYNNITDLSNRLFKGDDSIAKQIAKIQANNTELSNNLLIKELQPIIANPKTSDLRDNLRLYTRRFDTYTANQLTEAFRELKEQDPSLYKDIVDLGIIQSGLANSPITYIGIIPFEYYGDLFNKAFEEFNKKNGVSEIAKFKDLFIKNNSRDKVISKAFNYKGNSLGQGFYGKDYSDPNIQFSKKNNEIIDKLKSSGFIAQTHGDLFIKQHFYGQALKVINNLRKQYPGVISVDRIQSKLGAKGQSIFKVTINDQLELQFSNNRNNNLSIQLFKQIADKLSSKTGVNYEIITRDNLKDLVSKDNTSTVAGFTKNGKVYIVEDNLNSELAFHEFSHPFIDTITRDNKELFNSLKNELNNKFKDIIEEVKTNYSELLDENNELTEEGYKEAIVTTLGKLASNTLKENGSLLKALKDLLKQIANYLAKLFSSKDNTIKPFDLDPKTTLKELSDILKTDDKIELGELDNTSTQYSLRETKQLSKPEQLLQRRIDRLTKQVTLEKDDNKRSKLQQQLDYTIEQYSRAQETNNTTPIYREFGEYTLDLAENRINSIKEGNSTDLNADLEYINDVLDVWDDFKGLRDRVAELRESIQTLNNQLLVNNINESYNSENPITLEDIKSQNKDIGTFKYWTGALLDLPNYLAHAIGFIIRTSQNNIERKTNQIYYDIDNKIKEISKSSDRSIQSIYDEIIEYNKVFDTKSLIKEDKLNSVSKEAQEFYHFYQSKIEELIEITPTLTRRNSKGELETFSLNKYFIPNVPKNSFKNTLKNFNPVKERSIGNTIKDEEQKADIINLNYIRKIPANEKSDDLGNSLFLFAKDIYNYDEMSKILPKVRLIQREIEKTSYIQGSNPNYTKTGKDSNLYKITEAFIKAQIKGEYKEEQGRSITWGTKTDEKGNTTEKYLDITGTVDNLLRWNSLLRIGLSPVGASANVGFGKLSNFMEAIGGRFFNRTNLRQAEKIFWNQTFDENSILNKELLSKYNILQELTDYEQSENLKGEKYKKISSEKLVELMYSPQKYGEKWIQSSTLLAVMIHDGYLSPEGKLTDKFNNASNKEKEQLFGKITGVNNKLHGRYSAKEAAALQQNIIYRAVTQFRKWIPAAIEARFDEKHYDPRLGVEVEGRYRTFSREFLLKLVKGDIKSAFYNLLQPLFNSKEALESGKLTESEIYNMRKMLIESILAIATIILYSIGTGDDPEDKKRRKQAWFKSSMLLLNRVSGDLSFFYSPEQINNLGKNAIPMTKLVDDLLKIGLEIPNTFDEKKNKFKSGNSKGDYKLPKRILNIIPGSKVIIDPLKILNKQALDEVK